MPPDLSGGSLMCLKSHAKQNEFLTSLQGRVGKMAEFLHIRYRGKWMLQNFQREVRAYNLCRLPRAPGGIMDGCVQRSLYHSCHEAGTVQPCAFPRDYKNTVKIVITTTFPFFISHLACFILI